MDGGEARRAASAVVLAGGASRRFGRDKRTVAVEGRTLLARAVATVSTRCDEVLVVLAPGGSLPDGVELPDGVRVVHDRPGPSGPVAGLAAGLAAATHDPVLVLAADHPWADPRTLAALIDALEADPSADAAVAHDGRRQPLVGAYRRRVATVAAARLDAGDRRAVALLDHLRVIAVTDAPGLAATVRDVDVPADLDLATVDGPGRVPDTGVAHAERTGHVRLTRIGSDGTVHHDAVDQVTGEEPLVIAVAGPDGVAHEVTTTLRTPGHEVELAVGFLHAEGLVRAGEVVRTTAGDVLRDARPDDRLTVHLRTAVDPGAIVHRHVTATASCGVCGRATIDDLLGRVAPLPAGPRVAWSTLVALPDALRATQATFAATGGLHATGIATADGTLVSVREDVGRHNALDAAIGAHVLAGEVPLHDHVVVLSGRVGFELVQKAAVAGIAVVVAVGAPTDLAVRTADAVGMTLVGFVRDGAGNVYTHPTRVVPTAE